MLTKLIQPFDQFPTHCPICHEELAIGLQIDSVANSHKRFCFVGGENHRYSYEENRSTITIQFSIDAILVYAEKNQNETNYLPIFECGSTEVVYLPPTRYVDWFVYFRLKNTSVNEMGESANSFSMKSPKTHEEFVQMIQNTSQFQTVQKSILFI